MKRKGLIAVLAAVMIMASAACCFADTGALKLKSTYPKNGQTNTSIENVGVKLYFSNPVKSAEAQKIDKKCVKIVDKNGKKIPVKVLFANDDSGLVLVLGDNTDKNFKVKNNSTYKLVIDKDFVDDQGNTLDSKETLAFTTFNQKMNMRINMIMMFVMFGGIMFLTVRQATNQKKEEEVVDPKAEAFNPYREAKRTGKTIEQVIAEEKKRRAKFEKKAKRKGMEKPADHDIDPAELLPYVYKVSKPVSIRTAGGTYSSGSGKSPENIATKTGTKGGGKKKK